MRFLATVIKIITCAILFVAVQYCCMATIGFLDWFFENLPKSYSVWDFPLLYIFSSKPMDYIIQWLPLVCLASSLLFFMKRQTAWAYFTILAPFFLSLFLMILFTFAAQMHVPTGQGLYSSGVLIGKVESPALQAEREAEEQKNTGEAEHGH